MTENTKGPGTLLVVGATGSVGRYVVTEAVRQGFTTLALVRDASRAGRLDGGARTVVGDVTRAQSLADAVADIDAVVFTHGSAYGDASAAETVDYGVIARHQIARVLVDSLGTEPAGALTFELVAEQGPAPDDLGPLFAALDKDVPGSVDGARDQANMPDDAEPERVRRDLGTLTSTK